MIKTNTINIIFDIIIASITGVLLTLSTPGFNMWPLAFIASFLLAYIAHKSTTPFTITTLVCGFVWYTTSLYWIYIPLTIFGGASTLASIAILLLFMLICSIFYWLPFGLVIDKTKSYMLGILTFIALEFFKSTIPLGGMPWLNIGQTQHNNLLSIQLVSIIGEHGLSFLILIIGYLVYLSIYSNKKNTYMQLTMATLLILFAFGWLIYSFRNNDGKTIQVKIIQTGIEQQIKWSDEHTLEIVSNLNHNLKETNNDDIGYDFLIMPEATYPIDPFENDSTLTAIKNTSTKPLIMGYLKSSFIDNKEIYHNTAALIKDGEIIDEYYKIKLAPFGEYFPLEKYLYQIKDYFFQDTLLPTRGTKTKLFNIDKAKVGIMICYDGVFTGIWRNNIKNGANLIAIISNDAWFGKSIGKKQHLAIDKIHAIEYGRYLIRSTQDGISGVITPYGEEILLPKEKFYTAVIPVALKENYTLFTFTGYAWYVIALLTYLLSIIVKKKNSYKHIK